MQITPILGRYLGRRQDHHDHRDSLLLDHDAELNIPMPSSVDVFKGLSLPVYDQGALGSCTANTGVLYRRFLAQKFPKYSSPDENLSRLFLYYQERKLNGDTSEDSGAEIRDIFRVLEKIGVCSEVEDPYIPKNFADSLYNDSKKTNDDALKCEIGAYHRVTSLKTAKSALVSGYAVALGFTVYASFENIGPSGLMPMPQAGERILGGHAVTCHGYDDDKKCLLIQNSWGPSWGQSGHFWMPYAFVDSQEGQIDMWIGHLGPKWR